MAERATGAAQPRDEGDDGACGAGDDLASMDCFGLLLVSAMALNLFLVDGQGFLWMSSISGKWQYCGTHWWKWHG